MADEKEKLLTQAQTQIEEFMYMWLRSHFQDKFEESVLEDNVRFSAKLKENGYSVGLSGYNEYILNKDGKEIDRIQVPVVF